MTHTQVLHRCTGTIQLYSKVINHVLDYRNQADDNDYSNDSFNCRYYTS